MLLAPASHPATFSGGPAGNPLPKAVHASVPASRTVGRRVIIVGDVHGCLEDLQMLLEAIARQDDIVIITGDITGKGPDVYGVRAVGCGVHNQDNRLGCAGLGSVDVCGGAMHEYHSH